MSATVFLKALVVWPKSLTSFTTLFLKENAFPKLLTNKPTLGTHCVVSGALPVLNVPIGGGLQSFQVF